MSPRRVPESTMRLRCECDRPARDPVSLRTAAWPQPAAAELPRTRVSMRSNPVSDAKRSPAGVRDAQSRESPLSLSGRETRVYQTSASSSWRNNAAQASAFRAPPVSAISGSRSLPIARLNAVRAPPRGRGVEHQTRKRTPASTPASIPQRRQTSGEVPPLGTASNSWSDFARTGYE